MQSAKFKEDPSCYTKNGVVQEQNSPRILIVDDTSLDVELLTDILINNGYQVRAVSNGHQALSSVAFEVPDLILMDIKMPDIDGYEVCQRLKSDEKNSNIPVIFISALDESEDIVKGFNAGGVDYIAKPFQASQILARIKMHLALHSMHKKLEAQNTRLQQEIDERKQAEKLLHEKEASYRAIVETCEGFIYICSRDYRVEFMNKRFIERTGYDGTGEMCYKVIHDRDSICPWCVNDRVFNGETVRWEVQSPKDNIWMYVVNTPLYHADGSISKQSMIMDITDRKRAEEALQEAHDHLEQLVEERTAELVIRNQQLSEEIEERRRVEDALRESEIKYRSIFETTAAATMIVEEDNTITLVNNEFRENLRLLQRGYGRKKKLDDIRCARGSCENAGVSSVTKDQSECRSEELRISVHRQGWSCQRCLFNYRNDTGNNKRASRLF